MLEFKEHGFIYENTFYVYKHISSVSDIDYYFKIYNSCWNKNKEIVRCEIGFTVEIYGKTFCFSYMDKVKYDPDKYTKTDLFLNMIFHPFSYKRRNKMIVDRYEEALHKYNDYKESIETRVIKLKELAETERKQLISKL